MTKKSERVVAAVTAVTKAREALAAAEAELDAELGDTKKPRGRKPKAATNDNGGEKPEKTDGKDVCEEITPLLTDDGTKVSDIIAKLSHRNASTVRAGVARLCKNAKARMVKRGIVAAA